MSTRRPKGYIIVRSEALAHLKANRAIEQREIIRLRRELTAMSALLNGHERRLKEIQRGIEILEDK